MSDAPTPPQHRRFKKRHATGMLGAALTALAVVEAGAPLCPMVDRIAGRDAGDMCRAVTLTAPGISRALRDDVSRAREVSDGGSDAR